MKNSTQKKLYFGEFNSILNRTAFFLKFPENHTNSELIKCLKKYFYQHPKIDEN